MDFLVFLIILLYLLSALSYFIYLFYEKKDRLQQTGYVLLFAGFLVHCVRIGYQYTSGFLSHTGYLPVHSLHDTLSVASWSVAGVFLLLRYKFYLKILGFFAALLAAIIMIAAILVPGISIPEKVNALYNSMWVAVHVVTIFIGEASLALAFGAGLLYLAQEHAIKAKKHGFFYKRLPSLDLLDTTGYSCIVVGFPFLTIGLILGMVYEKQLVGRFWSWTPKEVWSGITWLVYAALLHQRLTVGWRGRQAAIMAIIGFLALLFTFLGVNYFVDAHHGEFLRIMR